MPPPTPCAAALVSNEATLRRAEPATCAAAWTSSGAIGRALVPIATLPELHARMAVGVPAAVVTQNEPEPESTIATIGFGTIAPDAPQSASPYPASVSLIEGY